MNKILKLSLLSLSLFACTSNTMEEQKSTEPITSVESQDQDQDKQIFQKLVEEQAEIIEAGDYKSLSDLEANIQNIIDPFKGENKKEFSKCLLKALTSENMLIKIRNITSPNYPLIRSLFNDDILKFDPSKTLKEKVNENNDSEIINDENHSSLEMTDLPQEIIEYILILVVAGIIDEYPISLITYDIKDIFTYIKSTTNVCKKFYLCKGLLLGKLRRFVHQKLLNEVLCKAIGVVQGYNNISQILVNSGKVDIDEIDWLGLNPLLLAIRDGNRKLAKFLLKSGANTEIKNKEGKTPLIMSIEFGSFLLVELLLKYNANCSKSARGETTLNVAIEMRDKYANSYFSEQRKKIVELLQEKIREKEGNKDIEKESEN